MTILEVLSFLLVALGGTAVVLTHDLLRQVALFGLYGFLLSILFVIVAAPDVALSVMVVSAVLPLIILAALRLVRGPVS